MVEYTVLWKNEIIGQLTNVTPDMSYLEGTWQPNASKLSKKFTKLVAGFDAISVITDPTLGVRAILEGQKSNKIPIVVIGLDQRTLTVKLVVSESAIEWLIQNVPEDKE